MRRVGTAASLVLAVFGIIAATKLASGGGGELAILGARAAELGLPGMVAFSLTCAVSVVFFFPGSILMTASGAAFGLAEGFVVAQLAASAGAVLAFLVSRYLARRRVALWVESKPRFAAVDEAIGAQGFKIVVLTRCCPLFPYIFQNYAYGLTRVRLGAYAFGSFVGLVPATALFVYVGALGRAGVETAAGARTTIELGVRALGLAATLGVTVVIARLATRALERAGL